MKRSTTKRSTTTAVALLAIAGLIAACGSDDDDGAEDAGSNTSEAAAPGASTAEPAEEPSGDAVSLRFQSLAFQDTTIAATEEIVAAWNEANPTIQVELLQGSWDNVHDQLVTQFQGGTAPDVIHNESADILGFAEQGYLADLTPYLSDEVTSGVSEDILSTVTASDGSIIAAPTLLQSYVVFANTDLFEAAGVEVPTGDELSWDDFAQLATDLTSDGSYGLGWGLRSPTASMMSLSLGFDGGYFETEGDETTIDVGEAELEVPERVHAMAYEANAIDPVSLTQSGSDTLPGFYGGDFAMIVGGNFVAQQITESAPEGFNWAVLPPLAGSAGANQVANPQTLSVATESEHVEEAAEFINFFVGASNVAQLAQGDWLIPASTDARAEVATATGGESGWAEILVSGDGLGAAPFQRAVNFPQWRDQIATPAFQQYLADAISLEDLQQQLSDGWDQVNG